MFDLDCLTQWDQSVSIITCYFLAITKYPEVQTKAWAEMDAVVGQDRLPNFEDRESLPYLAAVCKELYRWLPIVPLGQSMLLLCKYFRAVLILFLLRNSTSGYG